MLSYFATMGNGAAYTTPSLSQASRGNITLPLQMLQLLVEAMVDNGFQS